MEGIKQKAQSEENNITTKETERPGCKHSEAEWGSESSYRVESSLERNRRESWPRDVMLAISARFEKRMPRRAFELYRSRFHRGLMNNPSQQHSMPQESAKAFWEAMWVKCEEDEPGYAKYLREYLPKESEEMTFPAFEEFSDIIKSLSSWKAAGCDGIYNYFIKKMTNLHWALFNEIREACMSSKQQNKWFYKGINNLVPKGCPTKGSEFRPITCMSNLYYLSRCSY